jgi:hypothetical protein
VLRGLGRQALRNVHAALDPEVRDARFRYSGTDSKELPCPGQLFERAGVFGIFQDIFAEIPSSQELQKVAE